MRIVHVFRAPIGGLFRHVIDLVKEQSRRGHQIGIFCDATFAGERNEKLLKELEEHLKLGLVRSEMRRNPHWTDPVALNRMRAFCNRVDVDVLHGHGSKGGLYARLGGVISSSGPVRAYTPHGGSLNYRPGTPIHKLYMMVERVLERGTGAFLFESQFIADRFHEFVGTTDAVARIVLNGLHPEELEPILPRKDAVDFLYIGEYRFAKGIDTMLEAMGRLRDMRKVTPTLMLVGQGPDEPALLAQVKHLKLEKNITFRKPMAAREAFSLAHTMIVPSRFESMPYVVIEAAGATVPMISTDVGGIPEIFGAERNRLIACDDVNALVQAMEQAIDMTDKERLEPAQRLARYIAEHFSVSKMTDTVLEAYGSAMARRDVHSGKQAAPITDNAGQNSRN
jgi:glycosyltransferase involved in cell wall biosynthesis